MTPDVNVLVAAFRKDHQHHASAKQCLDDAMMASLGGSTLMLLPPVITGFLRLVTNPKIFLVPDTIENAIGFVDALAGAPGVEVAVVGEEWPLLRQLGVQGKLQGNAIPDAWVAAIVLQLGEHLVTFDRGMKKLLRHDRLTVLS